MVRSNIQNVREIEPRPVRADLIETLELREKILKTFRDMWYEEYLLGLRENCKDLHEINFSNKIKLDNVILIKKSLEAKTLLAA